MASISMIHGIFSIKLKLFDIFVLSYIFFSSAVFFSHSYLYNSYSLSYYQLTLTLSIQFIVMLILWFYSVKSPHDFVKYTNALVKLVLLICILVGVTLGLLLMVDINRVFDFYTKLTELQVLVNPFQTSDEGIALRFSGIFKSALNFGLLTSFCLFLLLGGRYNFRGKRVITVVLLLLLASTINRNAWLTFIFIGSVIFFVRIGVRKEYILWSIFSGSIFVILILLLFLNSVNTIEKSDSIIFKVSTLYSRIEIWSYWLSTLNFASALHGHGVVAGIGEKHLLIDNGFLYLVLNSGLVSMSILIICIFLLLKNAACLRGSDSDLAFFLVMGLPFTMILNNVVLDPMLMHLMFFYPVALLNKELMNEKYA
jgi:hypothetical protein